MKDALQVRMNGGALSVPFILSFPNEKEFVEASSSEFYLHIPEKERKDMLKLMYREAKKRYGKVPSDATGGE